MVTEISGSGVGQSVAVQAGLAVSQRVAEPSRDGVSQGEAASQDKRGFPTSQVGGVFSSLRTRQDALNQAASVVREIGATIAQAGQVLDKMEKDLGAVVKMFPPYPIGNPERIAFLNSFGGLRKQIEALTLPPPQALGSVVGRLSGGQGDAKASDVSPADQGGSVLAASDRIWNIPNLDPLAASDAQVGNALDQVQSARSALENMRSGMWNDVVSFARQADSPGAEKLAAGTRDQLADLGTQGIGANGSLLQQATGSG